MIQINGKQLLLRLVVLSLVAVVVISAGFLIGTDTTFTAIITMVLLFGMVFVLLFYWAIILQYLIRHIFDKQKQSFDYYSIINFVFVTIVNMFYIVFYFQLLGGAFLQLFI